MNLKYRIAIILLLVAASGWALWPRQVIERVKRNGVFVYDTVDRVPLKRGLDLRGGMHLALEIDESRGTVADKSAALDNSLKVIRNRIDQFGVAEPVVQKVGNDRIIVELPGIDDPQRAQELVQKAAFLQFQITDKTSALDRAPSCRLLVPPSSSTRHPSSGFSSLPEGSPASMPWCTPMSTPTTSTASTISGYSR